jgi:cytochrome c peroxidase
MRRAYTGTGLTLVTLAAALLGTSRTAVALDATEDDYELKLLGKYVFFDKISNPPRMACVTCHDPDTGGTGSVSGVNLHQVAITGANPHTVGGIKPPTNAYASLVPAFAPCGIGGVGLFGPPVQRFCGGNFWNGRAEGDLVSIFPVGATKHIGPEVFQGSADPAILGYAKYFGPTADQALNPMPNPVEQNIDRKSVCAHVAGAKYAELYRRAWGEPIDCSDSPVSIIGGDVPSETEVDISFKRVMLAVGAWQHSSELNSFSSKRDAALRAELACLNGAPDADPKVCTHPNYLGSPGKFPLVGFTDKENLGHDLFYNTRSPFGPPRPAPFPNLPVTNCSFCHLSDKVHADGTGLFERYADDAYHNIGIPVNPELAAAPNPGLSGHAGITPPANAGGFRTQTLRNVDKRKGNGFTKAYGHNGYFKSLEGIVHFYNTSRVKPACPGPYTEAEARAANCWPAPEWPATQSAAGLIGQMGLSAEQEAAVVAYLKTLTDTVTPQAPPPYEPTK